MILTQSLIIKSLNKYVYNHVKWDFQKDYICSFTYMHTYTRVHVFYVSFFNQSNFVAIKRRKQIRKQITNQANNDCYDRVSVPNRSTLRSSVLCSLPSLDDLEHIAKPRYNLRAHATMHVLLQRAIN